MSFVDKVANQTRDAAAADISHLAGGRGIADADIVRLCELVAFLAFQIRVISGLRSDEWEKRMTRVVHKFTRRVPEWQPRLVPVKLEEATQEQLDALKVTPSNTKVSDYVLTLAHDVESLSVRSPLFNAIMYDRGGMSREERELGALAASMVNRCIYCAAVHADRHAKLAKDETVTDELVRKR